jgi:hypothetical protein
LIIAELAVVRRTLGHLGCPLQSDIVQAGPGHQMIDDWRGKSLSMRGSI